MLQVNFTDTKLSHRFIRFEVPSSEDFITRCASIKEFLDRKLQNRSTTGVVLAKMQEDTDLNAQDDAQVISKASNKDTGSRFITVNISNIMFGYMRSRYINVMSIGASFRKWRRI